MVRCDFRNKATAKRRIAFLDVNLTRLMHYHAVRLLDTDDYHRSNPVEYQLVMRRSRADGNTLHIWMLSYMAANERLTNVACVVDIQFHPDLVRLKYRLESFDFGYQLMFWLQLLFGSVYWAADPLH